VCEAADGIPQACNICQADGASDQQLTGHKAQAAAAAAAAGAATPSTQHLLAIVTAVNTCVNCERLASL
jgi:hypothetical protein